MKFFHNIYIALLIFVLSSIFFCFALFHYELSAPGQDNRSKTVEIAPGSIDSIADTLKKQGLIRSKLCFKIYIRLTNNTNLKAGIYSLNKNMGVAKIVDILENGGNSGNIKITFQEGLNMRGIALAIASATNNTEDEVFSLLKDKEYLNRLIDEYWFLSNVILDDDIYYSLEGYLYPSTYYFDSKNISVETIIETMLDETGNQLENYQEMINNSDNSLHELLTLASIVELEGVTLEDRKSIAGVLYNRLDNNMNLGSDVTTYYGAKVDMGNRDLYAYEVEACNHYNTRCTTFKTLPIAPICNPSLDSILAVLEPDDNNYLYFVADKNKKVYFSKSIVEHNNIIAKLKSDGLWYEYE